jgi:hypothetical protein
MTRLVWEDRNYEVGVEKGVYYPRSGPGVAWNGLTQVTENPTADEDVAYRDGVKIQRNRVVETFSGTIEAFTCPDVFFDDALLGIRGRSFGFSYQALTANSYKIHLVYNVFLPPSNFTYRHEEIDNFSWEFATLPEKIPGGRISSHVIIDPSMAYPSAVQAIEDILYGSEVETPRLPLPEEVFAIFEDNALLKVTDNGDGTFTITGPDAAIQMLDSTTFQVTWPSVVIVDDASYRISSW